MSESDALRAGRSPPAQNDQYNSSEPIEGASFSRRTVFCAAAAPATRGVGKRATPQTRMTPATQVERILRAFNTWSFKREQPSDPQLLQQFVGRAVAMQRPISFVFYWGKGPRCRLNGHDIKCLDYLGSMADRIAAAYPPGAEMRLIFTDTHARLNGYPEVVINAYFASVAPEAAARGFSFCRLSELITATHAQPEDYANGDPVPEDMLARLCVSAMKWYHGPATPREGAIIYFHMNMIEKRAVELAFPDAIFGTFNNSKFRLLFPKRLPIFYMYSLQRGVSVKPWFLPVDAKLCTESCCYCRTEAVSGDR
ncbi:MAG TPA: hypothetical protein VNL39_00340 [Xanthobacteraceae bacterium]|nr:hypothetical protein [Xanthobacteraceae bacterium]